MENGMASSSDTGSAIAQSGSTSPGPKEKVTQGARGLIDRAESEARARVETGQKDAAQTLASIASTLLSSSAALKGEDQAMAGEYAQKAAEQVERLAQYVQDADPAEVVEGVQQFARRRPALFIGAAFAVGIIGARFLKSSRRRIEGEAASSVPGSREREVPTVRSVEPIDARSAS